MGALLSTHNSGRRRSKKIDEQLQREFQTSGKECKILVMGPRESGKTTVVNQIKIIHQGGFSTSERLELRAVIYRNVLDSAQSIGLYMRQVGQECAKPSNGVLMDKILDYRLEHPKVSDSSENNVYFSPEITEAIHQLRKDPTVVGIMTSAQRFRLSDSAAYFLSELPRVCARDYIPSDGDILRSHVKTVGSTEAHFTIDKLSCHMFDVGGQPATLQKLMDIFEPANTLIFCTAISDYDQPFWGNNTQNRMTESLLLFDSVINSPVFFRTVTILFLNKVDIFKNKLDKIPLASCIPGYTGGPDINKAAKFILWTFMQKNRARLSVYPYLTNATDTMTMRLTIGVIKETLLQASLRKSMLL